jgi:hypothetical protein
MDFPVIYNINDWINDKQQPSRYNLISRNYNHLDSSEVQSD